MAGAVSERIRRRVNATVHGGTIDLSRYDHPAGDAGLFGPDSVVWRVHGDLPGMFTGGIAALLLQSLHPLAIAGVDQHSDFRRDPVGRLNRTAGFVSVTSYGSTEAAEAALARVTGTAPDGRPYAAGDPELLRWVHVAETVCFLTGHQRYGRAPLTRGECDDYFREVAVIAERLGATGVPGSVAEVRGYLRAVRPDLVGSEAASQAVGFLRGFSGAVGDPAERAVMRALTNGAADLLPPWAALMLDVRRPAPVRILVDRPLVRALGAVFRYGCEPSVISGTAAARARARHADGSPG